MASLLVTGGAGFIGSNFVAHWTATRPGDRVTLVAGTTSADGTQVYHLNEACFVIGINWTLAGAFTQDLQCIAVRGVYASDNYHLVGQDLLGASGPNVAQLFY